MDLNKNEKLVLKALVRSSKGNGHDFGFTDEYQNCGFSKQQMAGYISQLQSKGYIQIFDNRNDPGTICMSNQFIFTLKAEALLDGVWVDSNH